MPLPHFAKRPVATLAALSLALAACGDSTAPDAPFDATGTSADLETSNAAFTAPAVTSFNAMSGQISAVIGTAGSSMALAPATALTTRERAAQFAKQVRAQFSRTAGVRPSFAEGVPAEYAGKTFEFDLQENDYVVSDRTGAPSNGVRFLLYVVDPSTGAPTESLTEIGYADITATVTETSASLRTKVVSEGVTYLDYTATADVSEASETVSLTIDGFATNGTDRAEFELLLKLSGGDNPGISIGYALEVPTSNFRITMQITASESFDAITMKLEARGENGRVTITGSQTETGESYAVKVNGDPFATITVTQTTTTVVGADGGQLSGEESETLGRMMLIFTDGYTFFFNDLVVPPAF